MQNFRKVARFARRLAHIFFIIISMALDFKLSGPKKLRLFFEMSGGGFLKFGQTLSLRSDFLPSRYIAELIKMTSDAPQIPFVKIQEVFVRETGQPVGKFFMEFDAEPISSSFISQSYKAKLKNGSAVSVKIQKPDVEEIFKSDLSVIIFLAQVVDFFKPIYLVSATEVVHDFAKWMRLELDFRNEAMNGDAFLAYGDSDFAAIIPAQYLKLTTKKVLIEEFIESGISIEKMLMDNFDRSEMSKKIIEPNVASNVLVFDILRQYFVDGFFHADARPSNIMILPENKVAFIDFGIVGESGSGRLSVMKFLRALSLNDTEKVATGLVDFGESLYKEEIDLFIVSAKDKKAVAKKLFEKIKEIIIKELSVKVKNILASVTDISGDKKIPAYKRSSVPVFFRLMKEAMKYGIVFPPEIPLFFRSLAIAEMTSLHISDNFDMIKAISLFFERYSEGEIEAIIESGKAKTKVAQEKINSVEEGDWEEFLELIEIRRERSAVAKEKIMEIISGYAEKNKEIMSLLKSAK